MMRKTTKVIMALLLSQSVLANAATHPAGMSVLKTIYQYAHTGNRAALESLKQQGYSLDVADKKGNTVLCASVLLNDKVAYNTLIAAGADVEASCMDDLSNAQRTQFCGHKGLIDRSICVEKGGGGLFFDNAWVEIGGLALIGTAAAAAGGGGGGGGGNDEGGLDTGGGDNNTGGGDDNTGGDDNGQGNQPVTPPEPEIPLPEDISTLPVETDKDCLNGTIINGICTIPVTSGADGSEAISTTDETANPMMLAEFGGSVSNDEARQIEGDKTVQKIAMQANGVGANAVSEDGTTVDLSKTSKAVNTSSLTLTETSEDDQGVIGMKATSAGTIKNSGDIAVNALSENQSAAMLAEGKGARVESSGNITLTAAGKTANLSGIHAADRQVANTGIIDITLGAGTQEGDKVATIHGMYGADVHNNGTINIGVERQPVDTDDGTDTNININTASEMDTSTGNNTDSDASNTGIPDADTDTEVGKGEIIANPIRSNLFVMSASPKGKVTNNGNINLDLTGLSYGVYGLYADASSGQGATLLNNKNIMVTGNLENDKSAGKQVVIMGAVGGAASTTNKGAIDLDIDVSKGGYLSVLDGFTGSVTNEGSINLNLKSDATRADASSFIVSALSMANGTATNKGSIIANLSGTAASGSTFYALYPTGSSDVSVSNEGKIEITSSMDHFDLAALASGLGSTHNTKTGEIYLTTSGQDSDLYATQTVVDGTQAEGASNSGRVVLTHEGGSGRIVGFTGGNHGILDIYAKNMDGYSSISGGGSLGGAGSFHDNNQINIFLTGKTWGSVTGYSYSPDAEYSGTSWTEDNDITITAKSETREGNLSVRGFSATGYKGEGNTYPISFTKADSIRLNLTGVADKIVADGNSLLIENRGLDAVGLYGSDSAVNTQNNTVISIDADLKDSTDYLIVGMQNKSTDGLIFQTGQAENDGTAPVAEDGTDGEDTGINGGTGEGTGSESGTGTTDGTQTPPQKEMFIKSVNNGTIEIKATGSYGTTNDYGGDFGVIGMLTNSYAKNNGTINITTDGNVRAAGMLAYDGGIIENTGKIIFTGKAENFVALYAGNDNVEHETGKKAVIYNTGTILVNNTDGTNYGGSGLYNEKVSEADENGEIARVGTEFGSVSNEPEIFAMSRPTVQINSAGVDYISEANGEFVAEGTSLSGDVIAGTSLTKDGNKNTYVASGSGNGALVGDGDWSKLGLSSASVLFNASYKTNENNKNGIDIVMTRRSFNEMTDNKSLAKFLEQNYAAGNNVSFFNDLKSIGTMQAFNSAIGDLTANKAITKFTHEDLTAMREINFNMNSLMFANQDKTAYETGGVINSFGFKNDDNSMSQYALANKQINSKMKVGYAVAATNMNTDDQNDTTRQNSMFQVFTPISYRNAGWQMIATPQIGYSRAHYTRKGFNGTSYDGLIEKRIFALMNEARYPMKWGAFELAPTVELNAIMYNMKGAEDSKAYALTMPSDNNVSIEAGLGLYANHTLGNLKLNSGLMMYREFADPYNIKMGMNGMSGTFDLYSNYNKYRAMALFGFGYDVGQLNVYGNIQHFMETNTHTKVKTGLKYTF